MQPQSSRRTFLKQLSVAGAALPMVAQPLGAEPPVPQLENGDFRVAFDPQAGSLSIWRRGGAPLLTGATIRATTKDGRRAITEPAYRRIVETRRVRDLLGEGQQLVARCTDAQRELDFELRVTLHERRQSVLIEAVAHNTGPQGIVVRSLQPICGTGESGGTVHWPQAARLLTNGPMYYDAGKVTDFSAASPTVLSSWWNVGVFSGYGREGLACGYVQNHSALGQMRVRREGEGQFSLTAESVLAQGFLLAPGQTVSSGPFMLTIGEDAYAALEVYAGAMGALGKARVHSVINGWCDWFSAFESITEDEVIRNAEFAAKTLRPYGFEYVQVDEGFQRWHGDWEGNAKFPHGMKWLADRIRGMGLKPGIWLAPYVISEPTELFQRHPEWLLRHPDGRLKRVGPWSSEDSDWARNENPKRYGLDITHPGGAQWLEELFATVSRKWGYQMIKIDFVDWSLLSAPRYHDSTVSRAAAYRRGVEIMRRAMGPDCHLLDCGPGPVSVGMLDSMRIELDQPPVTWKQYFLESASSAPAAAKRYYFHKRAWINDVDHIALNLLPLAQAQAAATLIALSGGNTMSGDRLPDLDATRLEILKKVFPSYGEAARPVDLFDSDRPGVFALKVHRPWGDWTVVGLFNASETEPMERVLPLSRLWLDPARKYVAFDFWREQLHGEVADELRVKVPPASVLLLSLHEQRGLPQVVATDRHVLMGALELENSHWDAAARTLEGVSLGPANTAHNVFVHVPEPHPWVQGGPYLYHDFPGYTVKMMNDHLLRIRVRFGPEGRVAWPVRFDEFFKRS